METISRPSFAKVNLGLQVVRRRADGFHELRTFFQMIDWADDMEFEPLARRLELVTDGLPVPDGAGNLVLRAARALRRATGIRRGARIRLLKRVPVGAGLGGGSSNAATTLLALGRLWRVTVPFRHLVGLAAGLGADVPFFLSGGAAFATGRGDRIRPLAGTLNRHLLLACPPVSLATGSVFAAGGFGLTGKKPRIRMRGFSQALSGRLDFADLVENDLEEPALRLCPEIEDLKRRLREIGSAVVAMTGSGPAVYGLFPDRKSAERAENIFPAGGSQCRVSSPVSRDQFRETTRGVRRSCL